MALTKLFLPDGARISGTNVVLSNGLVVPGWVCVAIPIDLDRPDGRKKNKSTTDKITYYDLINGKKSLGSYNIEAPRASESQFSFADFSSVISIDELKRQLLTVLPEIIDDSTADEVDPGYYEQSDGNKRPITEVTIDATAVLNGDYQLSKNYQLKDALIWRGRSQNLVSGHGRSEKEIVTAAKRLAVNVIERIDDENIYVDQTTTTRYINRKLKRLIYSWIADNTANVTDQASYYGESVSFRFDATWQEIYRKAVDMAVKLPFDQMWIDYRSDGAPLITISLSDGSGKRRVGTRYDGAPISTTRLLNCDPSASIPTTTSTNIDDGDVQPNSLDDYWGLFYSITQNPALFGGTVSAQKLLQSLGFNANPFVNALTSSISGAGTAATAATPAAVAEIAKAITCPSQTNVDPKLFPTGSHPAMRSLTDLTQMDDTSTQDKLPFNIRANNPLGVKVVKGVTDLKTRFGFLGEAQGIAVYRDHVGGAAAGLNYLLQTGSGATMGSMVKSLVGDTVAGTNGSESSLAKVFSSVTKHLFGAADPSGALAECATVGTDMESTIGYAASVAKSASNLETSPLTHAEWASAYQIAKNEPNGHLTKTTTGKDLPAQEETDTQDTGTVTQGQGKETNYTTDTEKRGKDEKWNPLSNFEHYAQTVWKDLVDKGLLSYQQKSSESDKDKIAKKDQRTELSQNDQNPTTFTDLDWTV